MINICKVDKENNKKIDTSDIDICKAYESLTYSVDQSVSLINIKQFIFPIKKWLLTLTKKSV